MTKPEVLNLFLSLRTILESVSWFGRRSISRTWPFLSIPQFYETPSWDAAIWAGIWGKAVQSEQLTWRWDVDACPQGAGVRLKALGMNLTCWCIFSPIFSVPAALICKQDLNQPTQMNLNNDWRLSKRCWLPAACFSPCRSFATRSHIIYIHTAALKSFFSIMGNHSIWKQLSLVELEENKFNFEREM